jgi:hypothetical protein
VMVKLTALAGDNATSGLLVDGDYHVHRGPDEQGRVWVFDDVTDSFRTLTPAEYREVPDPLEPHELVRIDQQADGFRVACRCVWRPSLPAADPDAAASTYRLLHLQKMERECYQLTAWTGPQLIWVVDDWHKRQWRRRRGEEPKR